MNTSKSSADNRIVLLTAEEIETVTGGKSVVPPPKSSLDLFSNWANGGDAFPTGIRIPESQLTDWETVALGAGGAFFRNAGTLITFMREDGSQATIELT